MVVGGVPLRISEDLEYIVESDLFVLKSVTSDREILTNIVNHSYRIRTGYRTARVESRVGYKRQIKYRELRGDSEAKVFISKCKSTGGPAPPTTMAISIIRYYLSDMNEFYPLLGIDKYPGFLELVNKIELIPDCPVEEDLRGKWMRCLSGGGQISSGTLALPEPVAVSRRGIRKIPVEPVESEEERDKVQDFEAREKQLKASSQKKLTRAVQVEQERGKKELSNVRKELEQKIEFLAEDRLKKVELCSRLEEQIDSCKNSIEIHEKNLLALKFQNESLIEDRLKNVEINLRLEGQIELNKIIIDNYEKEVLDLKLRNESLDKDLSALRSRNEELEKEWKTEMQKKLLLSNSSRCGAYGEKICGDHIASAFQEFGRTDRNAGIESHCADFMQTSSPWFIILHELKYGLKVVSSKEGIDKLLFDIKHTEAKFGKPVLAATLICWRSNVATMAETPISFRMAPNNHTLLVCVNNVEKQSCEGGHDPILRVAYNIVKNHVETSIRILGLLVKSSFGQTDDDLAQLIRQDDKTKPTEANKFLIDLIKRSSVTQDGGMKTLVNFEKMALNSRKTQVRGRSQVKGDPGVRSESRHWDTARSASVRGCSVSFNDEISIVEAAVDDQTVSAQAIDEQSGLGVRSEIDRITGDMTATMTTKDTVAIMDHDGTTGAMIGKIVDKNTGEVMEYVHYDGVNTNCIDGIEVPRYVPTEWHHIFNVKKAWGPSVKKIAEIIMKICILDSDGNVKRSDLKQRVSEEWLVQIGDSRILRLLDFIFLEDVYTIGKFGVVHGIRFVEL